MSLLIYVTKLNIICLHKFTFFLMFKVHLIIQNEQKKSPLSY